jgi:repressor LexA
MYPRLLEGDTILCKRCTTVDSGELAVILYNGDEATVKKVKYVQGEDWLELIPFNPEYPVKRIEGSDLEQCRVLGKVMKLIRDV